MFIVELHLKHLRLCLLLECSYILTDFKFMRKFYYYSFIRKDSSSYICKNIVCVTKIIFVRTLYLLYI